MVTAGCTVTLLLLAWVCGGPTYAMPQRFPPGPPGPPVRDFELNRLNLLSATATKQPVEASGDYSDAIYAAKLAEELTRLEESKKKVYVDFISHLYMNPGVRRGFPADLQRLSRGAPPFHAPPPTVVSTSSTSFGAPPPGFAPHFGQRVGRR